MERNLISIKQIRQDEFTDFVSGLIGNLNAGPTTTATYSLASGVESILISYGEVFEEIPKVTVQVWNNSGDPVLIPTVSGKNLSGCYVNLSNVTSTSNYNVDVFSKA